MSTDRARPAPQRFDGAAARARCLSYRRRILDISQTGDGAAHRAGLFLHGDRRRASTTALMRREADGGQFRRRVSDVEGTWLHDPICDPRTSWACCRARISTPIASPQAGSARIPTTERRASRPRPVRSATASASRSGRPSPKSSKKTDTLIYLRHVGRRVPGGLDLGGDDDGRQSRSDNLVAFMDNNDFSGLERMSEGHRGVLSAGRERRRPSAGRRSRSTATTAAPCSTPRSRAAAGEPLLVVCQDRQGQGRLLHGARADLALSLA